MNSSLSTANRCLKCLATYPSDFMHCPMDGSPLSYADLWSVNSIVAGKYRIVETIGVGGMATVYKAEHIHFHEFRALKVIHSELARDQSLMMRFVQEGVVTRWLRHPNIVQVEDIERSEDNRVFISMELVEGVLLRDAIKGSAFPLDVALHIARQAALALAVAHQLGMVHRDIKPANLILQSTPRGLNLKILDFGIAKVKESRLQANPSAPLTLMGPLAVFGTPAYMSPEQALLAQGELADEIDLRADLYSLGTVLYQMLTGRLPFVAGSDTEFLLAQINTAPGPIQELRPDLPKDLCRLVMSCLAKNRNARPANCSEFIAALDGVKGEGLSRLQPTVSAPTVSAQVANEITARVALTVWHKKAMARSPSRVSYALLRSAGAVSLSAAISALLVLVFLGPRLSPKFIAPAAPTPAHLSLLPTLTPLVEPHKSANVGVLLKTNCGNARVFLDGELLTHTDRQGRAHLLVGNGRHHITVSQTGFQTAGVQRLFLAKDSEILVLKLSLRPLAAPAPAVLAPPPPPDLSDGKTSFSEGLLPLLPAMPTQIPHAFEELPTVPKPVSPKPQFHE